MCVWICVGAREWVYGCGYRCATKGISCVTAPCSESKRKCREHAKLSLRLTCLGLPLMPPFPADNVLIAFSSMRASVIPPFPAKNVLTAFSTMRASLIPP